MVLFEEAADILSGYRRVNVFDAYITEYFYKVDETKEFIKIESVVDLVSFAKALDQYKNIYVNEQVKLDQNGNKVYENDKPVYETLSKVEGFEPALGITTLEEYFSWIKNLGGINRKYTMLPLDEPHFVINADTRAIEIPADFKKNGIAVQGDDIAEVVYFEIDRYFDYIDFNNCEIFIEWETPKNGNEPGVKSVSPAYIKDIESKPGKLIFGWAISDLITKTAGNLKFAVRFFEWEDIENKINAIGEKVLSYSFSTLTAQAAIKPSIGFNPKTDFANPDMLAGNRIIQRLENGAIVGGVAAAEPIYTINLIDSEYDLRTNNELVVQAYSSDTGAISYSWKKQEIKDDTINEAASGEVSDLIGENIYSKVEDNQALTSYYVYYQNTGTEDEPIYTATTYNASNLPSGDNANIVLYEKKSSITPDGAGIYWAIAENRLSNSVNNNASIKAVFPKPAPIVFAENGNLAASGILDDANGLTLNVTASNTDGTLSYQWYKDSNYSANFGEFAENFEVIENATESSYKTEEQGHYKVKITNTRNNASKSGESAVMRVTNKATAPTVDYGTNKLFFIDALSTTNCPIITIGEENEDFDRYQVIWYLDEDGVETEITTITLPDGVNICSFNPADEEYSSRIAEISKDGDIDGDYFAKVIKIFNGTTAESIIEEDQYFTIKF